MELTGNVQGLLELVGGGSTVEVTPIITSGEHIADIDVDGVTSELYAPEPPTQTEVDVTPIITSGEHIADIEVDGVTAELYAPKNEVIYSTAERVIGKWLNGEVLYERTFTFEGLSYPDFAWSNNILGTVGSGIEIVEYEGYFGFLNSNHRFSNFSYYRSGGEFFTAILANNNGVDDDVSIRPNMNVGSRITIDRVTIRYIKVS